MFSSRTQEKMLKLCLILATFATFVAGEDHPLSKLRDKWVAVIDQPEKSQYLKDWRGNHTWRMATPYPDSKIKLYCVDFRLSMAGNYEDSCGHARVIVDDGVSKQTFCEAQHNFHVVGQTSKMTVSLITSNVGGGPMECHAKAIQEPSVYETIDLLPGTGIREINFPKQKGEDNDKAWKLRTTSNRKISVQCHKKMESPLDSGVCAKDILTVDGGEGPKVSCGYGAVNMISKGTEMTVRVETFKGTNSQVECVVQSISGPNLNEADNIKYVEEDSSEHGVSPGVKKTTCPCGKANRDSGSRIINGTEVNVVSKYPFMNQPVPEELSPRVGIHNIYEQAAHGESQKLKVKEVHIPQEWFAVKGLWLLI
ncbi:hypothetical protein GE061_005314 [Apolygus lucorum]|uniref:CUB domain-containing protein n=1 Tax=Apolygus lucorum TaxID=248454 RepID=A0A8S9WVX6_APOLU|nr:hypothetical protein GE061_005314 [Apolygus lucorum]